MPNPRANRSRSDAPRQLLLSASATAPQRRSCSEPALLLRSGAFALSAPLLCYNAPCSVPASLLGSSLIGVPVSSPLCRRFPCQQQLRHGGASHKALRHSAPASNKPHLAEKSTPVWLAIWRTWAGFANSQLLRATFCSIYLYRCAHSPSYHIELLLRQTQICRPICTDCLHHLRISAG